MIEIDAAESGLKQNNNTDWNIEKSTYDAKSLAYNDFFKNHLIQNLPCLVKNITSTWESSEKWIRNDDINYEYFINTYGELEAPVADCNEILDYSQRTSNMKVKEYMYYLQTNQISKLLYLKDLHLKKLRPNDNFYTVPKIFSSDWLNEYAHDKNDDDFKFVYIGPKGSWTPLHADVYNSFSWSANVIGRKKWILFPPGEENKLKDNNNQLQLLFDPEVNLNIKHYVIIQEKGDAIFVPSGWYHQVENLLDTISINHNWNNGCNIQFMWDILNKSLIEVEHEISQFSDSPDYNSQCQCLLKALCGANHDSFLDYLKFIAKKRLVQLTGQLEESETLRLGINHVKFDLKMIHSLMSSIIDHPNYITGKITIDDSFLHLKKDIAESLAN